MFPKTIQIGSITWTIVQCSKLPDDSEDWGMCDADTSTIWIVDGPEDVRCDTFVHEVRHAIVATFGLRRKFKKDGEEDVIATETPILLQLFDMKLKAP